MAHGLNALHFPVLLSVPHAARSYPDALLKNLQASPHALSRLEDRYVDLLARDAIAAGFPVIMARHPRAWIDLNRCPDEIDSGWIAGRPRSAFAQPSGKVRGGLGLVPTRLVGHGNLWRRKWQHDDIAARIDHIHEPYHRAVSDTLNRIFARFGCAVLLDLHSMPPLAPRMGMPAAQCVIGDRFGRSAVDRLSDMSAHWLRGKGYRVALNDPYAGGYILERHGAPERQIHALQLEFDRSLYLDRALLEPCQGHQRVACDVAGLAKCLADTARDLELPQAAE